MPVGGDRMSGRTDRHEQGNIKALDEIWVLYIPTDPKKCHITLFQKKITSHCLRYSDDAFHKLRL